MAIIYEPSGKAKEYCDLAANLYRGCVHGCTYCYSPAVLRMTSDNFHAQATPRADILRQIKKEAPAYSGQEVHLCFTCDPYQPAEREHRLTRGTLDIFIEYGVKARILTKGGQICLDDLSRFVENKSIVGATLTLLDPDQSLSWEPKAALPADRIATLAALKSAGVETWASLEPVIDPAQSLELIRRTIGIVDTYKVGKWNHAKAAKEIDWARFADQAVELLEANNCNYYIKEDLRKFL